jgi:hypothetical protein
VIKACHRDVVAGKDDNVMRQWAKVFRTARFVFVKLDEHALSMYAFQLREDALAEGQQVGWTAMQRVQMVIREKYLMESRGGRVTASRLAAVFTSSVRLARGSDAISASFVDVSLTLESRVLSNPKAAAAINYAEDEYGLSGPFNSVYKMQAVVNRAKTPSLIDWTFTCLVDMLRMGQLDIGDFSVVKLQKELCDVALIKHALHSHFLVTFLDTHPFNVTVRSTIRTVLADHAAVRARLTNFPGAPTCELSWQASEKASTLKCIELIEAPTSRIPLALAAYTHSHRFHAG